MGGSRSGTDGSTSRPGSRQSRRASPHRDRACVNVQDVAGRVGVVLVERAGVVVGERAELPVRANALVLAVRDDPAPLAIPERAKLAEGDPVALVPIEDRRLHAVAPHPMPRAVDVDDLRLLDRKRLAAQAGEERGCTRAVLDGLADVVDRVPAVVAEELELLARAVAGRVADSLAVCVDLVVLTRGGCVGVARPVADQYDRSQPGEARPTRGDAPAAHL